MKWIDYESPESVEDAGRLLATDGRCCKIMAGGTDVLVQLRAGRIDTDVIVDLKKIPELMEVRFDPSTGLTLGAAVPCHKIYENSSVQRVFPGLVDSTSLIGGTQIQGRASVGGNLCNAAPSADAVKLAVNEKIFSSLFPTI